MTAGVLPITALALLHSSCLQILKIPNHKIIPFPKRIQSNVELYLP